MKVQVKKKEEGWEIEIDDQQLLDFLTMVYEKFLQMDKQQLELVKDETINKIIDGFLGGGKEE